MNRERINRMLGMNEDELDAVARDFENGTWDRSQYGAPGKGRPAAFGEAMRPVTFKETPSVVAAMDERAKQLGLSRSDYLRSLVANDIAIA